MDVLASAAAVIIEPEVRARSGDRDRWAGSSPSSPTAAGRRRCSRSSPWHRVRVGSEALSRFPADVGQGAGRVFEEAHSVGLGHQLELLALRRAAEHLAGSTATSP